MWVPSPVTATSAVAAFTMFSAPPSSVQAMLAMGTAKPWPEALKEISGEDRIDGNALLEYFAPLKAWLDEQNRILAAQQKG